MSYKFEYIEKEIIDQYLFDENKTRPWIIGFSGGKDSTMLLQIVWDSLLKIEPSLRTRPIYVISNDTLVENPKIVKYVEKVLHQIQKSATEQSLPIEVVKTKPRLEDTFWVNLIGKGYPAPNSNIFRWCTDRLKINPTSRFIKSIVKNGEEAIILLGTRSEESVKRARSIKKHEIKGKRLRKHLLNNVFVYAPIKDITTNEVWKYLMIVSSPWKADNEDLVRLYKNANHGDCPLVIDKTTPSCGHSRFGCWICTVVKRDKSMESLVENGEEWMLPLLKYRDELANSRYDRDKRENRRRINRKLTIPPEEEEWGAYTLEYRSYLLDYLLKIQKDIQEIEPNIELITHQELVAIQLLWYSDGYFQKSVSDIYNKIYNNGIDMKKIDEKFQKEHELLKSVCTEDLNYYKLISELLTIQKTKSLMLRRRGLQNDIENRIEEFIKAS